MSGADVFGATTHSLLLTEKAFWFRCASAASLVVTEFLWETAGAGVKEVTDLCCLSCQSQTLLWRGKSVVGSG